jgi:cation diffusion facilitator CzcD-associated flavoprotein CzcO
MHGPSGTDVAVIGAGFAGLGAGITLRRRGFRDFLIFERAAEVGGTWRDNTYPGCSCDIPSHLYSYSFAPNPGWSRTHAGQAEIQEYLRGLVDRFGLRPHLRLGHTVDEAAWDGTAQRWRLRTSGGVWHARVLIAAAGPFSDPAVPDIEGLDRFAGTLFHSARWRHDHDLGGRRVAVIGTGASAAQFVPEIAPRVGRLALFQRTPAWVLPRRSRRLTAAEQAIYRHVPGAQRIARIARYWSLEALATGFLHPWLNRLAQRASLRHLRRQVPDPALRARLTPDYLLGCKRVVLSDDYWRSLTASNVELVTGPIHHVAPDAVVTADGTRREMDTIILGTGFRVTEPVVARHVRGRDGVSLARAWTPTMRAYLGTMVPGFPNLFVLLGPNTGLGHSSVLLMVEAQLRQVVGALRHLRRTGAATIEPTAAAQERHTARVDRAMAGTVWTTGCGSWYLDATGRNSVVWPGYATSFRLRSAWFRPGDYAVTPGGAGGGRRPARAGSS